MMDVKDISIAVVGLGYVGLPWQLSLVNFFRLQPLTSTRKELLSWLQERITPLN